MIRLSTAELLRPPCENVRLSAELVSIPPDPGAPHWITDCAWFTVTAVLAPSTMVPVPTVNAPPAGVASTTGTDVFKIRQHVRTYVITLLQQRPLKLFLTLSIIHPFD
jgi:hypothetical protein